MATANNTAPYFTTCVLAYTLQVLAEVMATLSLYLRGSASVGFKELHKAVGHLKRGVRALQLRCQITKMYEGTFDPEPFRVDAGRWLRSHAPGEAVVECCPGLFTIGIGQALPDLAMSLSFGNCLAHGDGEILVGCTFSNETLRIEIRNRIRAAGRAGAAASLNQYSTGLGLDDLRSICKALGVKNQSAASRDGKYWHSTIYLPARRVPASEVAVRAAAPSCLPEGIRVQVADDQEMIPRLVKHKIEKHCRSAVVDVSVLDTTTAHNTFTRETLPRDCSEWDLVILDQHMPMVDQPATVHHGTDLITLLKQHGFDGCIVMHTGNSTADEIANYMDAGAHGAIGKGAEKFVDELCQIYSRFMGDSIPYLIDTKNSTSGGFRALYVY